MKLIYKIEQKNCTLNNILQNNLKISSRLLYKLIKNNCISLNGKECDTRNIASPNDIITINFDYSEDNSNIVPTEMDLNIVFEDNWLLIVNKPAGIATHPSVLHFSDSLCNGVRFYFDSIGLKKKVRPVNRLDLNTSGLVVFAKCEYIQECLISQMKFNVFKKDYLAICDGIFEDKVGVIDLPIARKENSIIERCISEDGQISITHYEVLKEFDNFSLVKCSLETGRTHQIRVHMSNVGHPLIGDSLYGTDSNLIERQALHCYHICFSHPIFKNNLDFVCDLPDDFKKLTKK
ncbi:RluA family pseudouridine synthase [bacterium]|nr:RluA family pseudouridine synthase [bacterium]